MLFDLSEKTAVVTGAARSVGAGIARCLAEQGAAVLVNDVDPDGANRTVDKITEAGGKAETQVFDVTNRSWPTRPCGTWRTASSRPTMRGTRR